MSSSVVEITGALFPGTPTTFRARGPVDVEAPWVSVTVTLNVKSPGVCGAFQEKRPELVIPMMLDGGFDDTVLPAESFTTTEYEIVSPSGSCAGIFSS